MPEALITAENLSLSAGGAPILDAVSLAVYPNEILTLIGPNGSGKTTLLKVLMGLVPAAGGIVCKPGLRIGYVPQQFARDASLPMTVTRFLNLFAPGDAALAALKRTGAESTAGKQISALSGGELARVLLARAIAGAPDLLVLDEPMAAVDINGEAELYHLIGEIRAELGCGILLVSHDLHVVMARSNRVICLNRHVCCEGHADAVIQDPAFRALFGGKAADEMALYAHRHHAHDLSGAALPDEDGHHG
jgi:zinc transport system ATP-binding protein